MPVEKYFEIEIERMNEIKATTIPVLIGALGLVEKGMEKYTQKNLGSVKLQELLNINLFGTSHIPIGAHYL